MIKRLFHLTEPQYKLLKDEVDQTGLKMAEIVRRAIDYYFENKEKK